MHSQSGIEVCNHHEIKRHWCPLTSNEILKDLPFKTTLGVKMVLHMHTLLLIAINTLIHSHLMCINIMNPLYDITSPVCIICIVFLTCMIISNQHWLMAASIYKMFYCKMCFVIEFIIENSNIEHIYVNTSIAGAPLSTTRSMTKPELPCICILIFCHLVDYWQFFSAFVLLYFLLCIKLYFYWRINVNNHLVSTLRNEPWTVNCLAVAALDFYRVCPK